MDDAIARLTQALRPAGVAYASFKLGEGELIQGGRLFNNFTEESLGELFHQTRALTSSLSGGRKTTGRRSAINCG